MKVSAQRRRWPEFEQRDTRWFTAPEAAASVEEEELATLIDKLRASFEAQSWAEQSSA